MVDSCTSNQNRSTSLLQHLGERLQNGDVNGLYGLLAEHPGLLDSVEKLPVAETPIHVALSAQKTDFAVALANLKPTLARKLSPDGLTPMHLALMNGQLEAVRALMTVDPELVRVKGRDGMTPLHFAASLPSDGCVNLIAELLTCDSSSTPSVIGDLTFRCETALHLALKNSNLEAFWVLLDWSRRVKGAKGLAKLLDQKDVDGNTVFHLAMASGDPEFEDIKVKTQRRMEINATTSRDKTALNPSNTHKQPLKKKLNKLCKQKASQIAEKRGVLLPEMIISKEESDRQRDLKNALLVVFVLIATATYQATLSPPGGVWSDSAGAAGETSHHRAGQWILHGWALPLFVMVNSLAFFSSINNLIFLCAELFSDKPIRFVLLMSLCPLSINYVLLLVIGAFPSMATRPRGIIGFLLATLAVEVLTFNLIGQGAVLGYMLHLCEVAWRWEMFLVGKIFGRTENIRQEDLPKADGRSVENQSIVYRENYP